MRFLIDAQLPRRLAIELTDLGHDSIHTLDLPGKNATTDAELMSVADRDGRIVITKDADFRDGHLLSNRPRQLLHVATGNIANTTLLDLVRSHVDEIDDAFERSTYVGVDLDAQLAEPTTDAARRAVSTRSVRPRIIEVARRRTVDCVTKRNHRRGGRTTPKGTRPAASPGRHERGLPPLVADAQRVLRERSPFGLLAMASGLIEATTARPTDSWGRGDTDRPDGPATFESFTVSGWPSMAALALAVSVLHPDELLARRLRAAVEVDRIPGAPPWLSTMGDIEVTDTFVHRDPLGDGENVVVSWRWPGGQAATVLVYVDHNAGTVVKDAFVILEDAAALADTYRHHGDPDIMTLPIAPQDARARIVEAIETGERMVPPFETDTWPVSRPMLEWVLRQLPAGGTGFVRPEWSEADRERLLDDFAASTFGEVAGLSTTEVRQLTDPLVWFACDFGPGDPLRWSPVSVEIVLADWYPRKVFGVPEPALRRLPDVLAGFVRYAHRRCGIAADLTDSTVGSIERWRADFLAAIARPGRSPHANAIRLARIAAGLDPGAFDGGEDGDDDDDVFVDETDQERDMAAVVDALEAHVIDLLGGRAAYDELNDAPLGEVPIDWSAIPGSLRTQTTATRELLDRWAVELFDREVRTIARHVLAGVVRADPGVFDRSSRVDALAAGILGFLLARLAGRSSAGGRRELSWTVSSRKDLAAATGVAASTIGARARTIANVAERADIDWPAILHSTQRREALRTKRHIDEWRDREP